MNKCRYCGVAVRDETACCPLCQCVLEGEGETGSTYPDVLLRERRAILVSRGFLFSAMVISAILIVLNIFVYSSFPWCAYPVAGLLFAYLILRFGVASLKDYRTKTLILLLSAVGLLVALDWIEGFYGWSVNYVVPGGILLFDGAVVVLMLTNTRNWQSYIIFQLGAVVCGVCPIVLWWLGVVTEPLVSFIALAVTVFLALGSIMIGYRRAGTELKRRFHI